MNQRYKPTVPKWLRRKLSAQQLEDLDLVHPMREKPRG